MPSSLLIRPFQPEDQVPARALVLAGLVEHWGWLDETRNQDLVDIASAYAQGAFLVGCLDGRLVATGALQPVAEPLPASAPLTLQVVRMSVAQDLRRMGLGKQMLQALLEEARRRGCRRVVLETTATWHEVVEFYLRCGFSITHEQAGDVYFVKELVP